MGNPYDDAFEEGNPYDTAIGDQIPPWHGLLQKAAGSLRQSQFGPFPFIPQSQEELQDVPGVAAKSASDMMFGIPEMASGGQIDEPQTEWGKQINTAAGVVPFALGGSALAKGIGKLGKIGEARKLAKEVGKVSSIQKSFFPFVKENTKKYGKALREGTKQMIKSGNLKVDPKEATAIFDKIKYNKDLMSQLPKRTKD